MFQRDYNLNCDLHQWGKSTEKLSKDALYFLKRLYIIHYEPIHPIIYSDETLQNIVEFYEDYGHEFKTSDTLSKILKLQDGEMASGDYDDPLNYIITYFMNGIFISSDFINWLSDDDFKKLVKEHNLSEISEDDVSDKIFEIHNKLVQELIDDGWQEEITVRGFDHLGPLLMF